MKKLPNFINGFKILKDYGYKNGSRRALVICKCCKREYEVDPNKLCYRFHCGCRKRGVIASRYKKQYPGLSETYKHMVSRCYNTNNKDYYNYGKRGIRVCKEWKKDRNIFFEWALKNGYEKGLSIDRINGNKGYNPKNCRWVNATIQGRNTRRNKLTMELAKKIRDMKKDFTTKQLMEIFKVSQGTIWLVVNNKIWI